MPRMQGVTTSYPLTNVSLAYKNDAMSFIAERIAPKVQVVKTEGTIYSYGADNLRVLNTIRSRGGNSKGVDWTITKATHYNLEDHSIHDYIPWEDYANEEKPIDLQIDNTNILTELIVIAKEYSLAQAMQDISIMTNNITLTGTDKWSDYINSDPIEDILVGINAVKSRTGKIPNTLILAWDAYLKLMYHPKIKDMFPASPIITAQMLKDGLTQIFPMIKNLEIGMANYNNSNAGAAMNLTEIWTKTAIVAYIEPNPTKRSRTLAYTYQRDMSRLVDFVSGKGGKDIELVKRKSDFIQVSDEYDQVLVDVNCGYLIKNCI